MSYDGIFSRPMAKVEITPEAYRQAQKLNEPIYSRVMAIVSRLEQWPAVSGAKPLRHGLAGHYRMRTGDYRIQFQVKGDSITVERIGHRDGFYGD
jgi:mRNA-degrading endonuclease RelE of RelBE toxin-antitoxin system